MLIGNFESAGISIEQAEAFNDGINKIAMLQNMLHVISNLSLVNEGYRPVGEINSESLQNLFMDMEQMAADTLSIYDHFEVRKDIENPLAELLSQDFNDFSANEVSSVITFVAKIRSK